MLFDINMGRVKTLLISGYVAIVLGLCLSEAHPYPGPDGLIKRAKRDIDSEYVGDALYDIDDGDDFKDIHKRDEISVPSPSPEARDKIAESENNNEASATAASSASTEKPADTAAPSTPSTSADDASKATTDSTKADTSESSTKPDTQEAPKATAPEPSKAEGSDSTKADSPAPTEAKATDSATDKTSPESSKAVESSPSESAKPDTPAASTDSKAESAPKADSAASADSTKSPEPATGSSQPADTAQSADSTPKEEESIKSSSKKAKVTPSHDVSDHDEEVAHSEDELGSRKARDHKRSRKYKPKKLTSAHKKSEVEGTVKSDVPSSEESTEAKDAIADSEGNKMEEGMDSNIDHPFVNSELTKKYDVTTDTSHGDMLGMDEPRDNVPDSPSDNVPDPNDSLIIEDSNDIFTDSLPEQTNVDLNEDSFAIYETLGQDPGMHMYKRDLVLGDEESRLYKRDDSHHVADTHDMQDGGAPSHFQVDDKSADLEINANSAGVKVKAKPASLQVVSRPGTHSTAAPQVAEEQGSISYHEPVHYHPHHHHHHHHRHHHPHFFHHHHHRHHQPHHVHYEPEMRFMGGEDHHHDDYHEDEEMEMDHGGHHHEGYEMEYDHGHGEMPHYFSIPRYGGEFGHGMGGSGGYGGGHGRHWIPEGAYSRSTVESAIDPRLDSPNSLGGFNSALALPDTDRNLVDNLRAELMSEHERMKQESMSQLQDAQVEPMSHLQSRSPLALDYLGGRRSDLRFHDYHESELPLPLPHTARRHRLPLRAPFRAPIHETAEARLEQTNRLNDLDAEIADRVSEKLMPYKNQISEEQRADEQEQYERDAKRFRDVPRDYPDRYIPELPGRSEALETEPKARSLGESYVNQMQSDRKRSIKHHKSR